MKRILIFEDDEVTAKVVQILLSQNGYDARIFVDHFEEAIGQVNWDDVDAVIVDRTLGSYEGDEILKWLHEQRPNIARIMLTANANTPELAYVDWLLLKPCPANLLLGVLEQL